MAGLPGSGKTTYAQQQKEQWNAVVFTPDQWHFTLFGDDLRNPEHNRRHSSIESLLWETAKELLLLGTNVVLDFGLWAREEREAFRREALAMGVQTQLHYREVSFPELCRRVQQRNALPGQFNIPMESLQLWWDQFEPPTAEELLTFSQTHI